MNLVNNAIKYVSGKLVEWKKLKPHRDNARELERKAFGTQIVNHRFMFLEQAGDERRKAGQLGLASEDYHRILNDSVCKNAGSFGDLATYVNRVKYKIEEINFSKKNRKSSK